MPVKTLNRILRNNRHRQIRIQFCSEGDGYYQDNKTYRGCVYVTPRTFNGELNHYSGRYYHDNRFKNYEFRSQFYQLVELYNKHYYERYGKGKIDSMFCVGEHYRFRWLVMRDMIGIIASELLSVEELIQNFSSEDEKYMSLEELEILLQNLNERLSYEIENS